MKPVDQCRRRQLHQGREAACWMVGNRWRCCLLRATDAQTMRLPRPPPSLSRLWHPWAAVVAGQWRLCRQLAGGQTIAAVAAVVAAAVVVVEAATALEAAAAVSAAAAAAAANRWGAFAEAASAPSYP